MIGHLALPLFLAALPSLQASDPPAPLPPVPSARQLAWHELGYYAFVHFGMNTFTDVEWGDGREDPDAFAPSALDCRQWAQVCAAAGMKGIILTAKHHDGFCLWPSETTEHTVAASAWRDGQGDVLRELSDACREEGLRFGVYLSPWDRNHPAYGDSDRYNEVFKAELREVLSNYGPVFEVWFDGACGEGPNGKRQEYDWPGFIEVARELQPDACIFSDAGPDVRWVGNEQGRAADTNWALLRRDEVYPGYPDYHELTEGHRDGTHWVPAECNTSIRPGWYYHPEEDGRVKSVAELVETWYASVGRGANFLLNLPVDRRGMVNEIDAGRLFALRRVLDATFANDFARGRAASASDVRGGDAARFGPAKAVDGDPDTYWATDDGVTAATITVELDEPTLVDQVLLAEEIALGQRVQRFELWARIKGEWRLVHPEGTTIGVQRIVRFLPLTTDAFELRIRAARASPTVSRFELYCAPPQVHIHAEEAFLRQTTVSLSTNPLPRLIDGGFVHSVNYIAPEPVTQVHYTLNGSRPTIDSLLYDGRAFGVQDSCVVRAIAVRDGVESLIPAELRLTCYRGMQMQPAIELASEAVPGLEWIGYEGNWRSLDELTQAEPVARGVTERFDIGLRSRPEHSGLSFRGYLRAPETGVFPFALTSDDGSRLYLDGELCLDNDGLHGRRTVRGAAALEEGWHAFRLDYFNGVGGGVLELEGVSLELPELPLSIYAMSTLPWLGR